MTFMSPPARLSVFLSYRPVAGAPPVDRPSCLVNRGHRGRDPTSHGGRAMITPAARPRGGPSGMALAVVSRGPRFLTFECQGGERTMKWCRFQSAGKTAY